ncbi:hypothetical protein [Streptomyces hyaluromycini]|uniref:hypothetical protein n=1 Tax=Streptomyces hyaluromycini TaxID=1377993 RepID=UPI0011AE536B|nr:hypothetical protein [Streptomyces hyaluromycini]
MTPRRRLFVRLSRSALGDFAVPILTLCIFDEGFSWTTVARAMAGYPLAWIVLSLLWAGWRTGSLVRRARGLGVEATEKVLDDTQAHTVTGIPIDRIRAELAAARQVSDLADGNPVRFRWHPYRSRVSVEASVAYDDTSGEARIEVRTSGNLESGLFRGAAFTALCRIAGTLEGR